MDGVGAKPATCCASSQSAAVAPARRLSRPTCTFVLPTCVPPSSCSSLLLFPSPHPRCRHPARHHAAAPLLQRGILPGRPQPPGQKLLLLAPAGHRAAPRGRAHAQGALGGGGAAGGGVRAQAGCGWVVWPKLLHHCAAPRPCFLTGSAAGVVALVSACGDLCLSDCCCLPLPLPVVWLQTPSRWRWLSSTASTSCTPWPSCSPAGCPTRCSTSCSPAGAAPS